MDGFHRMTSLFWHPPLMERFLTAKVLVLAREQVPDKNDEDFYSSTQAEATVFSNYFVIAKELLDENRLQEKLFFEKVGYFAREGLRMLEELSFPTLELSDLRQLAALSVKYIPTHKAEEKIADG
jgi:hypothetical protein